MVIMRKVELRMNEEFKYKTIEGLVVHNGNKKSSAIKHVCSIRMINRLIILYKTKGKQSFIQ